MKRQPDQSSTVKPMTLPEAELMMEHTCKEGWNPGIHDAKTFHTINPGGLLCIHENGKPVGFSSVMRYDDRYAFFGLYLVHQQYRGMGYGMEMTQRRLELAGHRCIGLDGADENIRMYSHIGFRPGFRNLRFSLSRENAPQSSRNPDISIKAFDCIPRYQLCSFDHYYFPACRSRFLDIWCHQPDSIALCALNQEELAGYIIIRPCFNGSKVGPLFARSKDIASELLAAASKSSPRWPLFLDIPEPNFHAMSLSEDLKMNFVSEVMRMYIGTPLSTDLSGVYSVTNQEMG